MHRLLERRLSQHEAAIMLGLSVRQTERLLARYRREGPSGFEDRAPRGLLLPKGASSAPTRRFRTAW
ncbi:MAG: helix-turn-helix domain-containing protein [Sandaracinaceae bacterium]|nr:helix-turn-helix domain-containing protein [Sandaracinaceae bacterium]